MAQVLSGRKPRKMFYLPVAIADQLSQFRFDRHISSEAEALRLLVQAGLAVLGAPGGPSTAQTP